MLKKKKKKKNPRLSICKDSSLNSFKSLMGGGGGGGGGYYDCCLGTQSLDHKRHLFRCCIKTINVSLAIFDWSLFLL